MRSTNSQIGPPGRARRWLDGPYGQAVVSVAFWSLAATMLMQVPVWFGLGTQVGSLPGPLLLSTFLLSVVVMAGVCLFGSLRWPLVVMVAVAVFVTVGSWQRIQTLRQPAVPADLRFLADPALLSSLSSVGVVVGSLVGVAVMVGALAWVLGRTTRGWQAPARSDRRWILVRVMCVVVAVVLLLAASGFNRSGNLLRRSYEAVGAEWAAWSDFDNYRLNGALAGALYTLPVEAMEPPAAYGREAMEDVVRRWGARSPAAEGVLDDTNVVVVLSESMGELAGLESVRVERDPLAHIHDQIARGWGGATVTDYGTGTATMEFQALTGQSMGLFAPQVDSPYEQFVPEEGPYPGLAGWLHARGHRTVALHGYTDELYRRPEAYRALGFDEFKHLGDLDGERAGVMGGLSDDALFAQTVAEIEQSDAPALVHVVTMQNHVPHDADSFGTVGVELDDSDEDAEQEIGVWAAGLADSDRAVRDLMAALGRMGQRTLVIYFGDHFPGILPGSMISDQAEATRRAPFFVWDSDKPNDVRDPLGTVAASSFIEVAAELHGGEAPGYLRLLRAVREQVGALTVTGAVRPDGSALSYDDMTSEQRRLVDNLRLVQYDFSVGERYALADLWYEPEAVDAR